MKKIIFFIIFALFSQSVVYAAEQSVRKIEPKDYFEIHCSLSGGMRQVIYDKYLFTFIEAIEKKVDSPLHAVSASLQSFVEIQKKTELNKEQEQKLRNWITKYNVASINSVSKPEKEDMEAIRYPSHLMVYIDSKEYDLDHYTIGANPELQPAFNELFTMAKKFTDTIYETSPSNNKQTQEPDNSKKMEFDFLQENLNKATTIFAHMMRDKEQFDFLAQFSNNYPKRYAILMKKFEEQRRQGNNFGWEGAAADPYFSFGEYLHKLVENNQKFTQESAMTWEKGWGLTISEVIPKLNTKNFASTRRIAIEFLKMKNNGEDFGYIWKDEPETSQNKSAISKWNEWFKNNKQLTK